MQSNLTKLKSAIRREAGRCMGINLKRLRITVDDAVQEYIENRGWCVKGSYLMFMCEEKKKNGEK